jgi:hypothetical protein
VHVNVPISSLYYDYERSVSALCIVCTAGQGTRWLYELQILSKLIAREHLTFEEAEQSLDLILHEGGAPEQIAAFLVLLAAKGTLFASFRADTHRIPLIELQATKAGRAQAYTSLFMVLLLYIFGVELAST